MKPSAKPVPAIAVPVIDFGWDTPDGQSHTPNHMFDLLRPTAPTPIVGAEHVAPAPQTRPESNVLQAVAMQHAARQQLSPSVIAMPGDRPRLSPSNLDVVFIPTVVLAAPKTTKLLEPAPPSTVRPMRVAYIVDISGSLVDSLANVVDWLEEAMDRLPKPVYFTVLFFRHEEIIEAPPKGMKVGTFRMKASVFSWMQLDKGNIEASGRSELTDAIDAAMQHDVDDVYILSDDGFGIGPSWDNGPALIAKLARTLGPDQPKIHTVQFYYRDPAGALEALADCFGGTYTFIDPPRKRPRFVIDLYGQSPARIAQLISDHDATP